MRYAVILLAFFVSACESCPPSFKAGDIVKHRLHGWRGIVLQDAASITNWEGYCLVSVRPEGNAPRGSYAVAEMELM